MTTFKPLFTTFYSYKGGVGRTSALVNTALLRAIAGDRVVVLDFDFEAPGISSYVKELAKKNKKNVDLDTCPGVLDYLYDAITEDKVQKLRENAISDIDLNLKIDGKIWFVGAGNTADKKYPKKLSILDWDKIFEENQGELLLENFKNQIINEFDNPDYIFIDSRTGITETGGVCTRYLADLVVVLSSLNDQNIIGTSRIFNAFKESNISTVLVASNVPVGLPWGEDQLFSSRIDNFKDNFCRPPDLLIYHYSSLSLMEYLPSYFKLKDEKSFLKEDPLLKSYEALSDKIELENKYSFDNFLDEIVFSKLMFHRDKNERNKEREKEVEEIFTFFNKHYSNRKDVFETTKAIYELNRAINSTADSKDNIDDLIKKTKNLKSAVLNRRYHNFFMIRRMVLRQASELILHFYSTHKEKLCSPYEWYSCLEDINRLEAIILLFSIADYEFIYKIISNEEKGYFLLAKAIAGEKINRSDALKYYELFLKDVDERKIENAECLFSCAYAAFKLGQVSKSKDFLKKSLEIGKKEEENSSFFIPVKFEKVKSKQEFLKALSDFEIDCNFNV